MAVCLLALPALPALPKLRRDGFFELLKAIEFVVFKRSEGSRSKDKNYLQCLEEVIRRY